jgi:hypothetical protein
LSDVSDAGSGAIMTAAERTKLTNIEAEADVTDADNVAAAGAVMNTGNESIDGVKTFTSTIVGDINGNAATVTNGIYTTSSVEELSDVSDAGSGAIMTAAERTKLTNIEAEADVTDAENVAAAGAVMNTGDESIDGVKTFTSTIMGNLQGNVTGNVTGNLTGQVLTASQTSITTMANLTTVGTIASGTWQGTAVADAYVANDLTVNGGDIDNSSIDASAIGAATAAAADVTTLTVEDATIMNESRDQAGDVLTIYNDGVGNVMTVSSTTGVHISDLTLNDSFTLTGNMSASTYTTTAGDPVNDNELARKAYVDAQIAANVSAFEVFDYDATASTINNTGGGNLIYFLNGANLFYQDNTAGDSNNASNGYTFTVYGSGMDQIATAVLYLRGESVDLVNNNNWASSGDAAATFTLTYQNLLDLGGGSQTDGVMRCHLVLDGKNSGLTFKFHLDSTSSAATTASFN